MEALRVLVLDDYQAVASGCADWRSLGATVDFLHDTPRSDAERAERFCGYPVIVAMRERTPFGAALLRALPRLRLLVTTGMGNAAIDMEACRAQGVAVCGAPGSKASAGATAELAWALILGLFKRLPALDHATRQGRWQPEVTQSLEGKVLGIVGLGRLGQRMAAVGRAFGMQVLAWSPHLTPERAAAAGAQYADKAALFAQADVVSLHLVLGEATRGTVGAAELSAMRPSAYLVNTARAALVDSTALLRALQSRAIAGAGLDVFEHEPLPLHDPLLSLPNVLLSPHVGYVTGDNLHAFYANAVRAIAAWQAGAPIRVLNA